MRRTRRVGAAALLIALVAATPGLAGCTPSPPPGATIEHVTVAGFGNETDLYRVEGAEIALVVLHGGGGNKTGMPHQIALSSTPEPSAATINWGWLRDHRAAVAFPQGGRTTNGRGSWNNGLSASGGPDDAAFLDALADHLRRVQGVRTVVLIGHSAGGMMASAQWCRPSASFDAYVTFAGPPAAALGTTAPCAPTVARPLLAVIGSDDEAIIAGAPWDAPTWHLFGTRPAPVGGLTRVLASEPAALARRATLACQGTPSPPVVRGAITEWTACDGRLRLVRVDGAQHALNTLADGLAPNAPTALLDLVWEFGTR